MRTLHKMLEKSMLASICIVGALIMALLPPAVVGAGSSESGFHISQWTGETWEEIYQHQFQVQYSAEAFTVDVVDGKVALRIVQVGTPFADVDQISLMVDGEELTPEYAQYTESGHSIVEDILELDNNVVLAHEQEIEVSWDVPAGYGSATVYLTANEYGHGLPLHFPETGYATYEMRSNAGSITVDGLITETDGTLPLYAPYWQPSSGHPDGYTYIYVCDDEEYVYFSLDVTGDNTNEYGEDWAEIGILRPDGSEKAFRIDDYDNTWGASGFGLTSQVSFKHQTYEFAIPKSIIGNENIEFSLAYYGTMTTDYYINAAIYLDIQIDGDSSEGQVFQVGNTLNITGLVSSEAAITVSSGDGVADAYSELSVAGPSGPASDSCSDHEEGTGYLNAQIYYLNEWTSLSYPLTDVGLHTITLYSQAHLEGQTESQGYVNEEDYAEITLDFWVGLKLSIDDVTVNEDAGNATFTVSLSSDPDSPVTVDYATSDGMATAGSDYTTLTPGTLTFNPSGPLTQTIDAVIIDDALHEVSETFHVNLTNATGEAGIYDDTGVGIIIDNDDGPTIGKLFMVNGAYGLWNDLIYDDGTAENNLNHGSDLGVSLVKFTLPGEPIRLTDLYFWMAGGNVSAELKVIIFDKDGNQVYLSEIYDSWYDGTWNSFDLDSESIPVMTDDFYAGIQHQAANSMFVGMDTSSVAANRSYWAYPPYTSLNQGNDNLMIRVGGYTLAGNEILELDPDTGAVTNTIPTPSDTDDGGDGLAYGDGRMFFTTIDTSDIYEIDPSDGGVNDSFPGPETYGGIDALGFSCDKLYALEYGPEPTIHILNPDTGATTGNLSPSVYLAGGGTFAGTRGSLFFSGYDDTDTLIYEINTTTGAVINSFSPPVEGEEDGLYGLGFSSSRNTLFVGYFDSNMVYEVDPDDGTVVNSFLGPEGAAISALAADEFLSSNDNFADAAVITGASGSTTGTNVGATIEDGEPETFQGYSFTTTVWWSWTATTNGTVAFDTLGSSFDTVMSAFTGDSVSNLTRLSENDDAWNDSLQSRIVFKVTAATTYHIVVAGYGSTTGNITLNWGYAIPPANDDFPGETISGMSGSSVFSSFNATREEGEPMHDPGDPYYAGRSSLWWSWTAPASGIVTFDTYGSVCANSTDEPYIALAIYTGTSLGSLTQIDYADWEAYEIALSAVGNTTYYIAVDGYDTHFSSLGFIHLNWSPSAPIFTSATSTTFAVGTAGAFNITTTAAPAASSISMISGTLPTGVNFNNNGDGTATLSGTPAAGTGNVYSLALSANNTFAAGTQNFTLTVNEAPAFVSASSTNFTVGTYGVFNLATTGYPSVASVGLTSGSLPSGITYSGSTMTLSGTPTAGTGATYPLTFSASNGISPDASQNCTLIVNEAPTFTSADNDSFLLNSPDSFTVTASGYPAPSIHLTSGTPPPGVAYNSSTGILSGTPTEGGTFPLTFAASNGVGSNATQNFILYVNAAPTITTPPKDVVVEEGQSANFTVEYYAYPEPTFQWQISKNDGGRWSNIRGANSATYDISATTSRMSGNMYRVIVSNDLGPATSDPATLTVMPVGYTTANVSIDKSDGVYDELSGTISWNITVTNSGPDTADGVTVADNLARGTRFSSITGISETQVKVRGGSVTVTIDPLANGESVNFTIVVQVRRATSPVDNTVIATVPTTIYDPDLSNNTASAVCSW